MYSIYITKPMDRFSNNGLTYPMNSHPTTGRNKAQPQHYNNLPGNSAHHITPIPCYWPTQTPEQVPVDWNIPFLQDLSAGYPAAPQPFVQDLNSPLPPFGARVHQNVARASQGADTLCLKNFSGGFPSRVIIHLQISWRFMSAHMFTPLAARSNPFRSTQLLTLCVCLKKKDLAN